MQCTHCGSASYKKNGKHKGSQRFVCKNCNRAFSDKNRKFSYADKESFLRMYLDNTSIRKAALRMGCAPSLLVRWVREFTKNLRWQMKNAQAKLEKSNKPPDIIEMNEIYTQSKKEGLFFPYALIILGGEAKLLHLAINNSSSFIANITNNS